MQIDFAPNSGHISIIVTDGDDIDLAHDLILTFQEDKEEYARRNPARAAREQLRAPRPGVNTLDPS